VTLRASHLHAVGYQQALSVDTGQTAPATQLRDWSA
jgi:hypothetical protein